MTKPCKITFCGDTSLGYSYLGRAKSKKRFPEAYGRLGSDPFSFFEGVASLLTGSDEVIVNLETVLSHNPGEPIEGKDYPGFDDPKVTIAILKKLGVTAVTLANNHVMDFGEQSLVEMIDLLHANDIATIGAGRNLSEARRPYVITTDAGTRIYIISCMRAGKRYEEYGFFAQEDKPGIANADLSMLERQIEVIKKADPDAAVIVCPHWQGIDYQDVDRKRKKWCRRVVDAGADSIIAHGTHKKDEVEEYAGKKMYFSIGNFVFNSPGRYAAKNAAPFSLVVNVDAVAGKELLCSSTNIHSDNKITDFNTAVVSDKAVAESNAFNSEDIFAMFKELVNNPESSNLPDKAPIVVQEYFNKAAKAFYHKKLTKKKVLGPKRYSQDKMDGLVSGAYPDHISHVMLRHIAKRKTLMERSVSFHSLMMQAAVEKRLKMPDYSWKLDDKKKAYDFSDSISVRRPESDPELYHFHEIKEPVKPTVIKPAAGTGARGVIFYYSPDNIILLNGFVKFSSWDEMTSYVDANVLYGEGNAFGIQGKWSTEEFVLEDAEQKTPARDLKFYCFYGKVFFILEISRGEEVKHCIWSRDGRHLQDTGQYEEENWRGDGVTEEQIKYAEAVSLKIPTPFMRIDMLKGDGEMVLGEFTPRPGQWDRFNQTYDFKLGKEFMQARKRLLDDLLQGKDFHEFRSL